MVTRPAVDLSKLKWARAKQMAARFALGAVVSVVAGIISKAFGARLGGVFLAFPAILPASLTFVEEREGERRADLDAVGAILGGAALVVFAAVGESMFGRHNSALVEVCALAGWLVAICVFYAVMMLVKPAEGEDS